MLVEDAALGEMGFVQSSHLLVQKILIPDKMLEGDVGPFEVVHKVGLALVFLEGASFLPASGFHYFC